MATTIYRLAEEIKNWLDGGLSQAASSISFNEVKIAVGQACNNALKVDYYASNFKQNELIPNGSVVGLYEGIAVERWNKISRARLPIKPMKLPRNIGVLAVYPSGMPQQEFIPIQMGQFALLQSQPLLNDLMGQVGRYTVGEWEVFTKDITIPGENVTVDFQLVIMDISLYGDYDPLPILPEMEWGIKKEVIQLYGGQPIPDKLVDPTANEATGVPLNQQRQS